MRYANITTYDINNGPGFRVSFFVQGCPIHCDGCFNQIAWDPDGGKAYTNETLLELMKQLDDPHISGLSILGGEPLAPYNIFWIAALCGLAKSQYPNKTIWLWSGYDFDVIKKMAENNWNMQFILDSCDVLVTGPFKKEEKDLSLPWRGSRNQEIHYLK